MTANIIFTGLNIIWKAVKNKLKKKTVPSGAVFFGAVKKTKSLCKSKESVLYLVIKRIIGNKKMSKVALTDTNLGNNINIELSVTLGTASLRINQLLKLGRGAVVELDRGINDDVDIYANDILIGHGEVVITNDETIGISITDIVGKNG